MDSTKKVLSPPIGWGSSNWQLSHQLVKLSIVGYRTTISDATKPNVLSSPYVLLCNRDNSWCPPVFLPNLTYHPCGGTVSSHGQYLHAFSCQILSIKVAMSVAGLSLWADVNCDGPSRLKASELQLDSVSVLNVINYLFSFYFCDLHLVHNPMIP